MQRDEPPYLLGLRLHERQPEWTDSYPFSLPWLQGLDLVFEGPVTFLVGENGSGKSTLIEAAAELIGLPPTGGGRADRGADHAPCGRAALGTLLRPVFRRRPRDAYFFRAEHQAHYGELLERRAADPDFIGDPYASYGGGSLQRRSHGEGFLDVMQNRLGEGLFLMDEPESALSPQRQLVLLALIADRVRRGGSQFVIATHSPILMTVPGAQILSLDGDEVEPVRLEDTSHYQLTRGILEHPGRYWQHLGREPEGPDERG